MTYKTTSEKIFIINRSKLEGRFDSFYYKKEFQELTKKFEHSKFQSVSFKEIIVSITNGFDFRDYKDTGIPYIKVANVKPGEFDFSKIQFIDFSSEELTKNIQLKKGNLLLTRKGTFGNALSLNQDYNYVISSEVFYIELLQEKVNSKYLEIFFNSFSGQRQFIRHSIGAIMGSLSQEAVRMLKVPLPTLSIQQEIVDLYLIEYKKQQQKEADAKYLLASTDTYFLNELGITLPDEETDLKSRIFKVNFSAVLGDRLDPEMILYGQKISDSMYPSISLGKLMKKNPQYGANEAGVEREDDNSPRYIRITDIDSYGFLKDELGKTASTIEEKYFLENKDILFARSGNTVGKSYIHNSKDVNYLCFFAGYMIRFVVDETKLLPDFLFAYTQSRTYKNWVKAIQRTSGQPNINAEEYKSLKIPLPPLEKQLEIANHILRVRQEAKQIQKEADKILEVANINVELLILGENIIG